MTRTMLSRIAFGLCLTEVRQRWARALAHTRMDGDFLDCRQRGIAVEYLGLEDSPRSPAFSTI